MADEINIDMEVTLLRKSLLAVINEAKLPITVKAMVTNELHQAVNSTAEIQVSNLIKNAILENKKSEVKEVEE